jgi:hypothetical protein
MGIDNVGNKGPIAPTIARPVEKVRSVRPFEVEKKSSSSQVEAAQPKTPFEHFQAGNVDVNGYIDMKVQEATSHLQTLSSRQLESVRSILRDHVSNNPVLSDLVGSATSQG